MTRQVYETQINDEDVTVLYDFEQEEPDTYTTQGTGAKVEIYAIHFKGIDIQTVSHPDYVTKIESEILEYHSVSEYA